MNGAPIDIFLVEDDSAHAEAIRRALEAAGVDGAEIRVAGTLREYREGIAALLPDIALMDLNLPDGRAVEVLSFPPETGPFPVLIMTSCGNEKTAVEALKSGALDYVIKSPEAFASMPRTVERALREWQLIRQRKQTEDELRESEAKYRKLFSQFNALLDEIPDNITLQGPDLNVLWANRAASLNKIADEPAGIFCYRLLRDRTSPCDKCPVLVSFSTGKPSLETFTSPDGKTWEVRSIPVKDEERVVSVIEIGRDISEQRNLEEQFRQAQKMEAVGRLAGGIAHDFNNMLNVILGFAGVALVSLDSVDPLYSYLLEIEKAGQRSADLIRQLLAFSRKQITEPLVINLNEMIEDQLKMLTKMVSEDININFVPNDDLWNIRIDPSQIDQIMSNLAVNARDAVAGVGTVTIETANVTLDETSSRIHNLLPGEYVMVTFSDTGAGMDAETLERIFEPFFSTKEEGKGTGLGLATVYGIVKQNEGVINVYSEPGMGTTFKIHFPRFLAEAAEPVEKSREKTLEGVETVLIVEDEEQILNLAKVILQQYGYKVLSAATPEEACLICEKYPDEIHLLLSDVVMPRMNGKELQARIENIKPGIKTLFMSGYTTNVIAHLGVIDQGVDFIAKPFTLESLAEKVRNALEA